MIVSASYRTDIPAFFGEWFMKRLDAGRCQVINPYGSRDYTVSLDRASVDGIVFWTRNPRPFFESLKQICSRGYPFVIQFTIVGYPPAIDRSVPGADDQVAIFRRLAAQYGSDTMVWRYDPIVLSSLTSGSFHRDNFASLCGRMAGSTDEVVVSFLNPYRKSRRNLDAAAERHGFSWWEATKHETSRMIPDLAEVAAAHHMRLSVCSQPDVIAAPAVAARCVDAARLSRVAGHDITAREKGNRPGCLCHEARDIGAYDTCPHGCTYCYAVSSQRRAAARLKAHGADDLALGRAALDNTL